MNLFGDHVPAGQLRIRLLQGLCVLLFLGLAIQLLRVQVLDPQLPPTFTDGSAPRTMQTEPARGLILDRNGTVLARNVPEFRVSVIPGELPEDDRDRRRALMRLESILGIPYASLESAVTSHLAVVDPYRPVPVKTGLDPDEAITIRARLSGLTYADVETFAARTYEPSGSLAHILGYVGPIPPDELEGWTDLGYPYHGRIGLTGVEASYETQLRGDPGARLVLADPTGRELDVLGAHDPQPGGHAVLAIDLEFQELVEEHLAAGIAAGMSTVRGTVPGRPEPSPSGAAVVMDVRTGELLALVSLPSYDPNLFNGDLDEDSMREVLEHPGRPLIDRTYMEMQPPGSIFKPVVAYAALEEDIAHVGTLITSTGAMAIENEFGGPAYIIRDWAAHGTIDMYGAMARSSDIYFYWLAGGYRSGGAEVFRGMGATTLAEWTRQFGFGRPTGIDLPGETGGLVPNPAWKEEELEEPWYLGDTYTFGIGQSYLRVTPLQMTVMMAAIANGGDLLAPRVVRGIQYGDDVHVPPPTVTGHIPGSEEHLELIRDMLRFTAHSGTGTARTGVPSGITIGAKTGTAEFGVPYPDGEYDTHGWFIAFAPYDEPEIAVTVYLEHGVGATHAGPVARQIMESYFALQEARSNPPDLDDGSEEPEDEAAASDQVARP